MNSGCFRVLTLTQMVCGDTVPRCLQSLILEQSVPRNQQNLTLSIQQNLTPLSRQNRTQPSQNPNQKVHRRWVGMVKSARAILTLYTGARRTIPARAWTMGSPGAAAQQTTMRTDAGETVRYVSSFFLLDRLSIGSFIY